MLSGRFNNPKNIAYMNKVKALLDKQGIPTYMVSSQTGQRFSGPTMFGLYHAKAMVVFGTIDYGAKTGAGYETFYELQYAHEQELHLIPIQLSNTWPPKPDNDKQDAGKIQNKYVLNSALLRLNDEEMEKPDEMAEKIAEAVRGFDRAGTEVRPCLHIPLELNFGSWPTHFHSAGVQGQQHHQPAGRECGFKTFNCSL